MKNALSVDVDWTANREAEVERIDGEPVISLEAALRFLYGVQEAFPMWPFIQLPYKSRVLSTVDESFGKYSALIRQCLGIRGRLKKEMSEEEFSKYLPFLFHSSPGINYWKEPVPHPDELRAQYPEGSYPRYCLDFELEGVKVEVKKAFRIVFNRAFGIMDYGEDPEVLAEFRKRFALMMRSMGIEYKSRGIMVCKVRGGRIVGAQTITPKIVFPDEAVVYDNAPSLEDFF